ncbi:MAG TPA: secretin, partial [Coxiellaceae bacterium]|nr:secretin [Coxiellaceae bacterium]
YLNEIKNIIAKLDIPVKQILIKARIINLDERYLQNLGISFGTQITNNDTGLNLEEAAVNFQSGQFNIPIVKLQNNEFIDLQLNALEQDGHAQIISSPELITNNLIAASIQSGEEVPYQEQTINGNTSVTFKKAVLKLKVTPNIMPQQKILLQLEINQDKISTLSVQGVPVIRTQELITEVLLNSKETVVLGGIYEQSNSQAFNQVPLLNKIPLVGRLFRQRQTLRERKKLLIFITPQIL